MAPVVVVEVVVDVVGETVVDELPLEVEDPVWLKSVEPVSV